MIDEQQANHLGAGDRLRISPDGLERHGIDAENRAGTYVSQFESPKDGRLVIVRLDGGGTFGFRLDEVQLRGRQAPC